MSEFGEHWQRKIKTWFKRFDKDEDGLLTEKDFTLIADNIIKVRRLSGPRADEIRKKYSQIWVEYFQPMLERDSASLEEIKANLQKCGKDEMKKMSTEHFNLLFDAVDTNNDGLIQLGEFVVYFQIVGVSEVFAKKTFDTMDTDHDGMLSRDEFVKGGLDFFTLEEPSKTCDLFYGFIEW